MYHFGEPGLHPNLAARIFDCQPFSIRDTSGSRVPGMNVHKTLGLLPQEGRDSMVLRMCITGRTLTADADEGVWAALCSETQGIFKRPVQEGYRCMSRPG